MKLCGHNSSTACATFSGLLNEALTVCQIGSRLITAEQKQHAVDNCFGQTIAVPSGPQRLFFVVCGFDMRAHRSALPECRLIGASENIVGQHYHDRCDH